MISATGLERKAQKKVLLMQRSDEKRKDQIYKRLSSKLSIIKEKYRARE